MLHLTFSMAPNIVFAPNIHRTQNTDTGRKTQTQLISALIKKYTRGLPEISKISFKQSIAPIEFLFTSNFFG